MEVVFDVFLAYILIPTRRTKGLVQKTDIFLFGKGILRG